jgi:hypothetical protein
LSESGKLYGLGYNRFG